MVRITAVVLLLASFAMAECKPGPNSGVFHCQGEKPPADVHITSMFRVKNTAKDDNGDQVVELLPMLPTTLTVYTPTIIPAKGEVLTCVISTEQMAVVESPIGTDTKENSTSSVITMDCGKDKKYYLKTVSFTPTNK